MTCARDSGDFWEKKEQMASWREKRSMLDGHVWVSHIGSGDMRKERADYIGGKKVNAEWTRVQETHDNLSIILILILMVNITLPFMKNWNILQLFVKLCTSKSGFILPMWHLDDDFFPSILLWSKLFYLSLICFGLYWITKGYKWVFTL